MGTEADALPGATALFGRDVRNSEGRRLGRIHIVVRMPDGERRAVVSTGGLLRRRRLFVSLSGAVLAGEWVVVRTAPAPLQLLPAANQPAEAEEPPHRAA
ncbi:MAG TPA: PRC-barrel domain-containing protein [Candidatus Angelobacter sp.]|jgi:hypothetical protein|nr:PRC-barrel domain-containing protein [Candidatus Angelobacter sp.]